MRDEKGSEIVNDYSLPINHLWEKLFNQVLVIRSQFGDVWHAAGFGVEIIRVELLSGGEPFVVLFAHEVTVGALAVPRIEGVVTDHGETFFGEVALIFENLVEVLEREKMSTLNK